MKFKGISLALASLTLAVLACTISVNTLPTTSEPGGGGVPTTTDTGLPPLPPPVMAVLRVPYIKSGNVWVWTEGTGSQQLTSSGNDRTPVLSSDGSLVAFKRNTELWVINADGTNVRSLVDTGYLATLETSSEESIAVDKVVWLPSSHTILFTTLSIAGIAGYQIPRFDLNSIDADATPGSIITMAAAGSGGNPYPAPGGSLIALSQPDKVSFIQANGTSLTVAFTFPFVLTYSEWVFVPELTWLSDSSAIRMVVPEADPLTNPSAPSKFWNIPVSGAPTQLALFVAMPAFYTPAFISPNAENAAYLMENGANVEIHSINASAADTFYISYPKNTAGILGWSPDSIRFTVWTPDKQHPSLVSGGAVTTLVDTPTGTDVQWVDENRFLFLDGNNLRLKSLDASSTVIDSGVTEFSHGIAIQ